MEPQKHSAHVTPHYGTPLSNNNNNNSVKLPRQLRHSTLNGESFKNSTPWLKHTHIPLRHSTANSKQPLLDINSFFHTFLLIYFHTKKRKKSQRKKFQKNFPSLSKHSTLSSGNVGYFSFLLMPFVRWINSLHFTLLLPQ